MVNFFMSIDLKIEQIQKQIDDVLSERKNICKKTIYMGDKIFNNKSYRKNFLLYLPSYIRKITMKLRIDDPNIYVKGKNVCMHKELWNKYGKVIVNLPFYINEYRKHIKVYELCSISSQCSLKLKEASKCPNCKCTVNKTANFCNLCGARFD